MDDHTQVVATKRTRIAKDKPTRQKKNQKTFTDLGLRNLKPDKNKQVLYWDTAQKGLALLVSPGGTKTFRSHFSLNGRYLSRAIGRLGENTTDRNNAEEGWSVKAARAECANDRALAKNHKDPRRYYQEIEEEKQRQAAEKKRQEYTYREAVTDYIQLVAKPTQRTWNQTEGALLRYFGDWLDRPVSEITSADLKKVRDKLVAEDKARSAALAVNWAKTLFRWLVEEHEKLEASLLEKVKAPGGGRKNKALVYGDEDIKAIWKAAGNLTDQERAFVRLTLLLAPRRTALAMMRWRDLNADGTVWTTPSEHVKQKKQNEGKGRTYRTPLPLLAQRELAKLQRGLPNDRVFSDIEVSTNKAGRPLVRLERLVTGLRLCGGPEKFGWHAFRHTIATWLEDQGHDPFDRALVLNHALGGVTAVYSHGYALERKRAVLTEWAEHVSALVGAKVPSPGN